MAMDRQEPAIETGDAWAHGGRAASLSDLPLDGVTASDFRAWRGRMGWTQSEAEEALDLGRRNHRRVGAGHPGDPDDGRARVLGARRGACRVSFAGPAAHQ